MSFVQFNPNEITASSTQKGTSLPKGTSSKVAHIQQERKKSTDKLVLDSFVAVMLVDVRTCRKVDGQRDVDMFWVSTLKEKIQDSFNPTKQTNWLELVLL